MNQNSAIKRKNGKNCPKNMQRSVKCKLNASSRIKIM